MGVIEKIHRYFIANPAPVLSIRRQRSYGKPHFIPMRCANSRGFWWRNWFVTWRVPYSHVWAWNPHRRAWDIAATLQKGPGQ